MSAFNIGTVIQIFTLDQQWYIGQIEFIDQQNGFYYIRQNTGICFMIKWRYPSWFFPNDSPVANLLILNSNINTNSSQNSSSSSSNNSSNFLEYNNQIVRNQIDFIVPSNYQEEEFKTCMRDRHSSKCVDSPYPKDRVPISKFIKGNQILKTCDDCRNYDINKRKEHITKRRKKAEQRQEEIQAGFSDFGICTSPYHTTNKYPRDKVPISDIAKDPENLHLGCFETCLECRLKRKELREESENVAESKGLFYCVQCNKSLSLNQRATNIDGTISTVCKICQDKIREHRYKIIAYKIEVKIQRILENEFSCEHCKCLFLSPIGDSLIVRRYQVGFINGVKYVRRENGEVMTLDEFFTKYEDQLETIILDWDHLPENEARATGLLAPDEHFIPKCKDVSRWNSIEAIDKEIKKCQLVCKACHKWITILRELGRTTETISYRQKREYVNSIKINGCISCGSKHQDIRMLRFYEFDHLDQKTKRECVTIMVYRDKFTLDDVKEEVVKCRVLCAHCHAVHSRNQRRLLQIDIEENDEESDEDF
ncbi:MAG: hypothetical protein Solivirus3_6 [Solivirus sp.]|uniref:Uncharacterized protein n=1 Tax=Solivirus sp. TaxID=2487772 RepID=A0A3G5AFL6_9VIRU|nr:MAG: hypothetical protein Solivirus3_6 [Solivirus sp.]